MKRARPAASSGSASRSVSRQRVLQCDGAGFLVHAVLGQSQPRLVSRVWEQAYAASKKYGNDGYLDRIHKSDAQKAAEERPASEQPDVPPCAAFSFSTVCLASSETVMSGQSAWRKVRDRTYECTPGISGPSPSWAGRLVCLPAHENCVERTGRGHEVNVGIHQDPVALTIRSGDVSIEAHRNRVTNSPHAPPRRNWAWPV